MDMGVAKEDQKGMMEVMEILRVLEEEGEVEEKSTLAEAQEAQGQAAYV